MNIQQGRAAEKAAVCENRVTAFTTRKLAPSRLLAASVDLAKAGGKGHWFAEDVQTAGEFRKAQAAGHVPVRLERLLKDSLGLDPDAQHRRLERRMEEQLAAEAMEGFPEISEEAKGRLPHPETLRSNNHPLYGEVRRLWEALKKPTKRRTKDGRTVDRTTEANAFFLPIGEMLDLDRVRDALNERGFAFDTITDMLGALDVSLSYGKPVYGTASMGQESWAMGNDIPEDGNYQAVAGPSYAMGLSAVHNLSAENLEFADRMGGLAVPSIAVVRSGQAIRGFGEITLVGGRPLADPSVNPVFDADAYTARYPEPVWKKVPQKVAQAMVDRFRPYGKAFSERGWSLVDAIWDNSVNSPNPEKVVSTLKRLIGAKAAFLDLVHGIKVEPVMQPIPARSTATGTKALADYLAAGGALDPGYDNKKGHKALYAMLKAAVVEKYSAALSPRMLKNMTAGALDSSGNVNMRETTRLIEDQQNAGKIGLDATASEQAVDAELEGKEAEFYQWIESQIRGMFADPQIKVGGKLRPYTLQNIVDVMTSGAAAGKEKTLTVSEGQIRAMNSHRFSGLEEMRNYAAGYMVTEAQAAEGRKALTNRLAKWRDAVMPFYKYSSAWDALDNSMTAMARFLKGPRTAARMAASLRGMDFAGVPQSLVNEAMEIGQDFMDAPVPYFESKPQRIVRLDEFHAAVVPDDATPETLAILQRHGIKVETIPADRKNDETAVAAVLPRLLEGPATFAMSPADLDPEYLAAVNAGDMEKAGKLVEKAAYIQDQHLQADWLFDNSKVAGYISADEYNKAAENGFIALCIQWRKDHPRLRAQDGEAGGSASGESGVAGSLAIVERDEAGEIIPLAARFPLPESTQGKASPSNASMAMSTAGVLRLDEAIQRRMTRGPDERIDYFTKVRDRLAATVLMLRERKGNVALDLSDAERERNRVRDALSEMTALHKALPPDVRGRVLFQPNEVLDQDTERGQVNALIRFVDRIDEAIEGQLRKDYFEAFETLLDLAKPDLRQNKQLRGRLTPETQRLVGKALEACVIGPADLAVKLTGKQAEIDALEASQPEGPEAIQAAQKALVELYQEQVILETFGNFSALDAEGMAKAYEQLQSIYVRGRTTRKIMDEARRAVVVWSLAHVYGRYNKS